MSLLKFTKTLSAILFTVSGTLAFARVQHPATGDISQPNIPKTLDFIENKGQWPLEAKFKADIPSGAVFLTDKGFVYNYYSQDDLDKLHDRMEEGEDVSDKMIRQHAYKVNFVGANTDIHYTNEQKRAAYNNYFLGNDKTKWASNVSRYGKVTMNNIYEGIDMVVYGQSTSPKYDFVVKAGADPSVIQLSFDGVKPVLDAHGNVSIKTSVNEIIEQAPYSYQVINGQNVKVESKYTIDNKGNIHFTFPNGYNNNYALIIDPILVFATYSGGNAGSFYSYSTTYDALGNMLVGCEAYNTGWPVTTGAFQSTFAGSHDIGINKYNASGTTLIFSTYYGGASLELPHTLLVNNVGELVVAGSTTSSNLPTTTGAYDATLNGTDIFVAHFNIGGTGLIGATYLGGSSTEPMAYSALNAISGTSTTSLANQNTTSPVELLCDAADNIWVVSSTQSSDFPTTAGAVQGTFAGGTTDGTITKLNPTCTTLMYSSYIGGTGGDVVYAAQLNSNADLIIGGLTTSSDFPTTTGTYHPTFQGGDADGFVAKLNPTTGAIINSTYLGTNNSDHVVALQIDVNDNIYTLGRTLGDYPISTGVYNVANGDLFIDKLTPNLSGSLLSTRMGAQQSGTHYFPTAFLLDICENIYVCGLNSIAGMPVTPDAYSPTYTGRFWFGVLEPNFSDLLYGSYFGLTGDHTHTGVNRLDPTGIVYHSICNSQQYPGISPTVYCPQKLSSGQDIVSFKFNFEATGVNSNFVLDPAVSGNDTGCAPYQVHFLNTSTQAEAFTWNFGDGSPTSSLAEPIHVFNTPGTYTISLHANNDSSCITDDTAFLTITVMQVNPPDFSVNDTLLCSFYQNIDIGMALNNPSPYNTIQWGPLSGIVSANNTPTITVDPSINNVYYVTVKDTIPGICGFSSTDTVHIDLSPRELDIINNDSVVCEGAVVPINAIGSPGYTYVWTPSTGVSDPTALSPNITINQPNIYTLTASYPNCPDTSVTVSIGMHFMPHLTVSPDKFVCQGTDVNLESNVTPYRSDYIYSWAPATPNLTSPNGPNTHFIADTTITYYLNVQTPIGCADDDTVMITVYPIGFGSISPDTGYCSGTQGSVNLWAAGGTNYTWSPSYGLSGTTGENVVASPPTSTEYTVLIENEHHCLDTEKVKVDVFPAAILTMPDSVNIYSGEAYQVEPGTNCLYFSWFPPSGLDATNVSDPSMSPQVRTRYFVNATTEHGCSIADSIDIIVNETVIDMPNAFKPGGTNSTFKPSRRGISQLISFDIYNRWGNKVFSTTNIDNGWDGTFNDKPQPLGVYVYVIDAVSDAGKRFTKQGTVTLVR